MTLKLETEWNQEAAREVIRNLVDFNKQNIAPEDLQAPEENFSLVLRDEAGAVVGGLVGMLYWRRLKIEILWLHENLRGQGQGSRLLQEMERLAREKGARLIELDTISFQAPEFYKKHGYEVFGKIENFPDGHTHYHYMKWL
ncbi:putative N-acetyltransferase YhbS [Tumebacillus sp. BK434]|uniref:GNAT family N-acetyltransferase n=1 Tax=Tumebacillus sp. BK434 TaxID=2512169 RepID=UPI0010E5DE21|nr:GNAT family N-acetyltransferase [Tumebacillus sp. BK434]TCP54428.1 putative N-acetyltransferase YhbS [Tumebacillus sp. BK434]